jgi:hypothetical protein
MRPELKRRIQYILAIAIAVAAVRTGYILEKRHSSSASAEREKPAAPPLDADYYVTPKKLHAYDLKSARELTQQPVWIKEGYRYTFFRYDPGTHKVDFEHETGQLLPLQKLDIKDVVLVPAPESSRERLASGAVLRGQKQVVALFDQDGKHLAVPIGNELNGDYRIYADEMLFIQDPRQLYKHWPADVWNSVDKHEVKPGMNELQADFAVGMGTPEPLNEEGLKTVKYPNGGKPLRVTYRDGKAIDIHGG